MITKSNVKHITQLACIKLDDKEVQEFAIQLNAVLEYFEELEGIAMLPPEEEEQERNVLRADETKPSLTQEAALSNAPRVDGGYFKGPRIL
jgi:aspartyl-tRNA(Asn)/glutamyl-tRNA(Gln) amidotransferase subunit C